MDKEEIDTTKQSTNTSVPGSFYIFWKTNFLSVPPFSINDFLLSALDEFPEVNIKGEKKEVLVEKYTSKLVEAELSAEKTLSKLTEERLEKLGIPLGHAAAIAEAAQRYGKKGL